MARCGGTTKKKKQNLSPSMRFLEKWNTLTSSSAMSEQMTLAFQSRSSIPKVHRLQMVLRNSPNCIGIESLEKLMRDFSLHHKTAPPVPGFIPRNGDLVSARFSDGSWYRAKVRRASPPKKEAEVTFIDYGNKDTVSFADIRPLDSKFRGLPGQAHDARLRCVPYWYSLPIGTGPRPAHQILS